MIPMHITGEGHAHMFSAHVDKLRQNPGDCGIDLFPCMDGYLDYTFKIHDHIAVVSIPTKVRIAVPDGHFAWITPRSSAWDKLHGAAVIPGIIDHGYTGEYRIRIQVIHNGNKPLPNPHDGVLRDHPLTEQIKLIGSICYDLSVKRQALAQVIIIPFARCELVPCEKLPESARGDKGYGSTDK